MDAKRERRIHWLVRVLVPLHLLQHGTKAFPMIDKGDIGVPVKMWSRWIVEFSRALHEFGSLPDPPGVPPEQQGAGTLAGERILRLALSRRPLREVEACCSDALRNLAELGHDLDDGSLRNYDRPWGIRHYFEIVEARLLELDEVRSIQGVATQRAQIEIKAIDDGAPRPELGILEAIPRGPQVTSDASLASKEVQRVQSEMPSPATHAGGQHPLHAEILHFMESMYWPFCREKINKWKFVGIAKPFRVTDFAGREIAFEGVRFDGAPRVVFWGGFVEPFLKDLIRRCVAHAVRLADNRGLERAGALGEARSVLSSMVTWAYHAMDQVELIQLNRGRETIRSRTLPPIQRTDSRPMVERMRAVIDEMIAGCPAVRPARLTASAEASVSNTGPTPSAEPRGPASASREKVAARSHGRRNLSDGQQNVLTALLDMGAVDRDMRKSASEVASRATGSYSKSTTRDRLAELRTLGLVGIVRGLKGGSFLTAAGRKRAERKRKT